MDTGVIDESILIKKTKEYIELENKYKNLKKKYEGKCRKRMNFFQMSQIQKRRFKKLIILNMGHTQEMCNISGLKLKTLVLSRNDESSDEKLTIQINSETKPDFLNKVILCKDIKNMSDGSYQALISFLSQDLPSLNQLREKKKQLNSLIGISRNKYGLFVCIESKLREILKIKISKMNINDETIHLCYHGDSTITYRNNTKLLIMTFSIINEGIKATTAYGTYIIGCFEIENENYEQICESVQELREQMKDLNSIRINEKEFKIETYFSADWKFLQICIGIKSANSKQPCLYCKYVTGSTTISSLKTDCWTMIASNNVAIEKTRMTHSESQINSARSIAEAISTIERQQKDNNGYINYPIFDFIPLHRMVIDMMHLFLRISDRLSELLLNDLREADLLSNQKTGYVNKYIIFLSNICRITNPAYCKENKLCLRNLMGPDRKKVFSHFQDGFNDDLLPGFKKLEKTKQVWLTFYDIYNSIKNHQMKSKEIKKATNDWLVKFLKIYPENNITPYIHAFVFHLHEFVKQYKVINYFNLEGVEKKNDLIKHQIFSATNRKKQSLEKTDYLMQLMQKQNRIDVLSYIDFNY